MARPNASAEVALITGANRGLGLETARQLRDRGLTVIMAARSLEAASRAAERLGCRAARLDVTSTEDVARLTEELGRADDRLTVLVNNAGVALHGFDADVVRRTLAVNVHGAMAVTDALLPHLAPDARIVNVSSGMGSLDHLAPPLQAKMTAEDLSRDGLKRLLEEFAERVREGTHRDAGWPSSAYSVSKVALGAYTRLLARELSGRNIKVNAVCPGWVRTDMGGAGAPRSVQQGARGIVWAAMLDPGGPTGGFFRDGRPIDW